MNIAIKWRSLSRSLRSGVIGFVVGAACTVLVLSLFTFNSTPNFRVVRESSFASSTPYTFTDPLISVSAGGTNPAPEYAALYQSVNAYIASQQGNGLSAASVNFRDIDDSDGFNINPSTLYDPASLTKVPLAMAYYDLAEQNPSILSQTIVYSGNPDLDEAEQIKSSIQLTPGQSYTVAALIEHMIRYSDNNAEQLLADHLSEIGQLSMLSTLFTDLGVKTNPDNPDYATVQSYSLFLRVLYNSTYLDRDYSETLLKLLSESDFMKGISAGVPNDVVVAQKFGDARIPSVQGTQVGVELQDCGIVYYPDHPYILCIMSKGSTIPELETVIGGVSGIVYKDMEQRYPS